MLVRLKFLSAQRPPKGGVAYPVQLSGYFLLGDLFYPRKNLMMSFLIKIGETEVIGFVVNVLTVS